MRPKKNLIASTTLDIMRGQGMKYAHAISDARQGVEGDLEKSKRQIKRHKEFVSYSHCSKKNVSSSKQILIACRTLLLLWPTSTLSLHSIHQQQCDEIVNTRPIGGGR